MAAFATVDEYRLDTGDEDTSTDRVQAVLDQQSAKLRALVRVPANPTGDQAAICRLLVTDAARKCLVTAQVDGIGGVAGVTQGSFSANGFQSSYTLQNPSGTAYFDRDTLKALKRSIHGNQRMGSVVPCYGRRPC